MHYSRKERRNLAKQLGLSKKNETRSETNDRIFRSSQAGIQINQQFQMQTENEIRNKLSEKEVSVFNSLINSVGENEANRILENNRMIEEKRRLKLLKRKK